MLHGNLNRLRTLLALLALLGGYSTAYGKEPDITSDISYGPAKANTLDICSMHGGNAFKPVVLLIHGGGWHEGDKSDMRNWCIRAAHAGMVGVSVNYRLADATKRETWWPAQLSDVQLALRWLRANQQRLGFNPDKFCALGDSAGGQLAVFLGAGVPVTQDDNAKLYPALSTAATCVVDNYGPVDMTDPTFGHDGFKAMFGDKTYNESPEAYVAASPLPLISAQSAPMFIAHGMNDTVVPFSQSLRLAQSLASHGVPVDFISFAGGHQEFGDSPAQTARIANAEMQYLLTH